MKVKCISESKNPKFPILNAIYNVYGIDVFVRSNGSVETYVSIYSNVHDSPVLEELENFEITDNRIPPDWVFQKYESNNNFFIQPQEFTGNFWDDYHDGNPEAEKIFKEVERKIKQFHGDGLEDNVSQ